MPVVTRDCPYDNLLSERTLAIQQCKRHYRHLLGSRKELSIVCNHDMPGFKNKYIITLVQVTNSGHTEQKFRFAVQTVEVLER